MVMIYQKPATPAEIASLARRIRAAKRERRYAYDGFDNFEAWVVGKEGISAYYANLLSRIEKHFGVSPHFQSLFEHPLHHLDKAIQDPKLCLDVCMHGTSALPPRAKYFRPSITYVRPVGSGEVVGS